MSAPSSKPQLSLQVTIQVAAENADAFLAALRPCWEAVIAEPECLFFDVFQDPEVPGKFRFIELWAESREWLETIQLTKPYYQPYIEKTQPMWTGERKLEIFERQAGWSAYSKTYTAGGKELKR